ncbi:glutamine synthetase, chloroplastic [Iris pallida]|uniref:Glutamine synthetase, chloroplastic n=1 Tax=Iris pallida TaxID=29817 RepID=A0AAX6EYE3_IRIPA|nr:glutamine synthetase, chloroplastic [Iris pallida]
MAQMLVPPMQCQMGMPISNSTQARHTTTKMWNSLLLNSQRPKARRSASTFKVFALKSSDNSGTVSRLEGLLNLDITPFTDKIIAEYIWIGGTGIDVRSKSRTISKPVEHPSELPKWNYDGSSTGQAPGEDSEVILYPQAIFKDPFRGGNNIWWSAMRTRQVVSQFLPTSAIEPLRSSVIRRSSTKSLGSE